MPVLANVRRKILHNNTAGVLLNLEIFLPEEVPQVRELLEVMTRNMKGKPPVVITYFPDSVVLSEKLDNVIFLRVQVSLDGRVLVGFTTSMG